ncbi:MAG: zinc ribbon domain-containing protein [Deltaproteobacteria bacterium]|nr:MAG: zinc ribbon domain-containing protein [Deltaproteobacteria bacterium]
MPTYDFRCRKCKEDVSLILSLKEYEDKEYACPKCGEKKLQQLITHFMTKTSRKS